MIVEITSLTQPGLEPYTRLTEAQLRNKLEPEKGIFICESPKVIRVALSAGYEPVSLLCERRHIEGDAKDIIEQCEALHRQNAGLEGQSHCEDFPVYTGSREMLEQLTGYTLTRGVLCAMRRPRSLSIREVLGFTDEEHCTARRVVVIDGVVDSPNVGSIFRSAAALGINAVLVTKTSCDPLNRRSVRVSMGSVFLVPWTRLEGNITEELHKCGFKTLAMALRHDCVLLDDPKLKQEPRLAILMGNEGDGLPTETITSCDYVVKIPMRHTVDSLNVAACSAVAFWELTK